MAVRTKTGIVLRNPAEKAKRYARQMKSGVIRETGRKLTKTDFAFRAGYLAARQDSADCFNATHHRRKNYSSVKNKHRYAY